MLSPPNTLRVHAKKVPLREKKIAKPANEAFFRDDALAS
jgi:hypothetical protein